MKVLIVEDETSASENLTDILKDIDPSIEIMGYTESVQQTVRWLSADNKPDLIFMDIHLSDGSSFAVFDKINVEIPIIFTTAYDEYAIDAFKVNSIDYLLKPVKQSDLERALDKFSRLSRNDTNRYIEMMKELASTRGSYKSRLLVPVKDKLLPIQVSDVSCFYTTNEATTIYLKNGQSYPCSWTLNQIMNNLDPNEFVRANKQFILSRSSIKNITIWFDSRLKIDVDIEVPERIYVSKNKAAEFKAWLVK